MALPLKAQPPGWVAEFKSFVMRGNVVDLAVGIVIGAAFTAIVQSLVKDIFNPVLGLLTGGVDFSNHFATLKGPVAPTIAEAQKAGAVTLNYGLFINACIQFIIVSFAVFWVVRLIGKLRKPEPAAAPAGPTLTETLLLDIRDTLRERAPIEVQVPGAGSGPRPIV